MPEFDAQDVVDEHGKLNLTFCFDLLKAQPRSSLFFLNYEARSVALDWIREQNFKEPSPFDPGFGLLFIDQSKGRDFLQE